jgi:hypothetical protein
VQFFKKGTLLEEIETQLQIATQEIQTAQEESARISDTVRQEHRLHLSHLSCNYIPCSKRAFDFFWACQNFLPVLAPLVLFSVSRSCQNWSTSSARQSVLTGPLK